MTRQTYVHAATIDTEPGSNTDAIGAAVTVELCGHWEHEPPCRWPHNNASASVGDGRVAFRTVFVAEPAEEPGIRSRIEAGLARGALAAPEGSARWRTLDSGPRDPNDEEASLGARLGS